MKTVMEFIKQFKKDNNIYGLAEIDQDTWGDICEDYANEVSKALLEEAAEKMQDMSYNKRHLTPYEAIVSCREIALSLIPK